MGVTGLYELIRKKVPSAIREIDVADMAGAKVAIDASLAIYSWYAVGQSRGIKHDGKVSNHIRGMFYRNIFLMSRGVQPIYVFDGPPPDAKRETLAERRLRRRVHLHTGVMDECRELLAAMGVAHVTADGDAEALAAQLCKSGYCDYVITQDSDALAFGAPNVIKSIDLRTGRAEVINLAAVLEGLGVTYTAFVDLCVLLGTDYNPPFCTRSKVLPLLQKWLNISGVLDAAKVAAASREIYIGAQRIFLEGAKNKDLVLTLPDWPALGRLMADWGMPSARVHKALSAIGL